MDYEVDVFLLKVMGKGVKLLLLGNFMRFYYRNR